MQSLHLLLAVLLFACTGVLVAQSPSEGRAVDPSLYQGLYYRLDV